eukprot:4647636-Pleurochrysis_carterae.AAC.1
MGCLLGFLLHKKISIGSILVERFDAPSDRRTRSRRAGRHARPRSFSLSEIKNYRGNSGQIFRDLAYMFSEELNETTD